jgi:TIR domain
MAFVPNFEHDIFVSYAHVDDKPLPGVDMGWVTTLIEGLRTGLSQKLGRSDAFEMWIDHKLARHVDITPQIMESLQQTATLLIILSPGYLASDWCQREQDTFLNLITERVRSGSSVFIVERDKLEDHERSSEFKKLIGYPFWVQDREDSPPRTLGIPKPNPEEHRYYDMLNELSKELAEELHAQKKAANRTEIEIEVPPSAKGPTVFLAEVTDDLDTVRDEVKRHLDQAGVRVLPNSWYSREPNAFENAVKGDLQKSDLFVQLLSGTSGKKAPDLPKGYAYLQFECAKNADKPIMQWHRRDLVVREIKDEEQQELLLGNTVFAVGIEEFKREVVNRAFYKPPAPDPAPIQTFVFVNMETRDRSLAEKVCETLDHYGAEYSLPIRKGTAAEIREDLERNLLECNGLVIIYGQATVIWVRKQLLQCRKIIYKRKSPLKAIAVYEGPPEPKDPLDLKLRNMYILNCRKSLNKNIVKSFIDNLRLEED